MTFQFPLDRNFEVPDCRVQLLLSVAGPWLSPIFNLVSVPCLEYAVEWDKRWEQENGQWIHGGLFETSTALEYYSILDPLHTSVKVSRDQSNERY